MARGGGHHSHHSSHHTSHHAHHSYSSHHYGRAVYGRGNDKKSDKERRGEIWRGIIIVCICFFVVLVVEFDMSFADIFSRPKGKLSASSVIETDYYMDEYGYVKDAETLTEGMRYFFNKTGIQPYVYYTDVDSFYGKYYTISGMDSLYSSLFEDEGHFLLIITGDVSWFSSHFVSYYYGADVERIMDEEAIDLFFEHFDDEALKQISADAVISNAFKRTAEDLTGIHAYGVGYIVLVVLLCVMVVVCIAVFLQKCRQRKMARLIQDSKEHDEILYDDMPEELHAPERRITDAVKRAKLLAEKEKEHEQKEIWGSTISWSDALKDMQENETVQAVADSSEVLPVEKEPEMEPAQSANIDEKNPDIEKRCLENKVIKDFEDQQIIGTENKSREDSETDTQRQDDAGYIPSVDWGFSLDKAIDLFSDEENDKK